VTATWIASSTFIVVTSQSLPQASAAPVCATVPIG
jgi:hypothetical protein